MKLSKGIIKGLHHVTATVNDAQEDYDFYVKVLGLRLVKETVNFDNESVYHFYYANKKGDPSTVFTTFPYKDQGVRPGIIGSGQVYTTSFSVPPGSLSFWQTHLEGKGVKTTASSSFGNEKLIFRDPSGLWLELVERNDDQREQWVNDIFEKNVAIHGIQSVTLALKDVAETVSLLEQLGYGQHASQGQMIKMTAGRGLPGDEVILMEAKDMPVGKNGLGTVHHVAHRVAGQDELLNVRQFVLEELKLNITEVKDRKYFKSIYFRIPGGVLFEVATEEPGFLVDEGIQDLGSGLKLPDWQEPNRGRILENLPGFTR